MTFNEQPPNDTQTGIPLFFHGHRMNTCSMLKKKPGPQQNLQTCQSHQGCRCETNEDKEEFWFMSDFDDKTSSFIGVCGKDKPPSSHPLTPKNKDNNTMIVRQTVTLIVHQSPLVVHLTPVPHLLLLSWSGPRNNQPPNFCPSFQRCQSFK